MRTGRRVRSRPVPPLPVEHEPTQLARRRGIRLRALVHQPGDGPIHRRRHQAEPPDDGHRGPEPRRAGHETQPQHHRDRRIRFGQDRHARHPQHPQGQHELRVHRPEGRALRDDRRRLGENGLHGQTARPGGPDQRDEIQPHALHRPRQARRGDHAPGHQHHGQHQRLHTQGAPDRRLLDQIRTQPADRAHRVRLLPARRHPQGLPAHRRRPDPQRRGRHARPARSQRTGRDQGKPGRRRRPDRHGDLRGDPRRMGTRGRGPRRPGPARGMASRPGPEVRASTGPSPRARERPRRASSSASACASPH